MFLGRIIPILFFTCIVNFASAHVYLETQLEGKSFKPGEHLQLTWTILVEHDQIDWDLYYTTDDGDSWLPIEEGLALEVLMYDWEIPEIESDHVKIRIVQDNMSEDYDDISKPFSVHSGTVSTFDLDPQSIALEVISNPFLKEFQFVFTLQQSRKVDLTLFNLEGKVIHSLVSDILPAGNYTYHWTSTDSAAYYFIRMEVERRFLTRKILFL